MKSRISFCLAIFAVVSVSHFYGGFIRNDEDGAYDRYHAGTTTITPEILPESSHYIQDVKGSPMAATSGSWLPYPPEDDDDNVIFFRRYECWNLGNANILSDEPAIYMKRRGINLGGNCACWYESTAVDVSTVQSLVDIIETFFFNFSQAGITLEGKYQPHPSDSFAIIVANFPCVECDEFVENFRYYARMISRRGVRWGYTTPQVARMKKFASMKITSTPAVIFFSAIPPHNGVFYDADMDTIKTKRIPTNSHTLADLNLRDVTVMAGFGFLMTVALAKSFLWITNRMPAMEVAARRVRVLLG